MTKEFESGMRYQGYAQTQGFNPIKPVDVTPLLRENRQTEQQNLQRMLDQSMSVMRIQQQQEQDAIQRQNELATLVSQQELSDLAEFSQTLTSAITTYQEYRKEKDIEAGMALAYTEGLPDEVVAKFKQDEAKAEEAATISEGVAASLEVQDAPTDLVTRTRSMSGWKGYGYARGIAQLGGEQYSVFYEEAAERIKIDIGGRMVTLSNAKNTSERAAVEAEIRRQYLKNFEGMNLGLLNEYLFPAMKKYEAKAATVFAIELRGRLQAERKTALLDEFAGYVKANNVGEGFIKLINLHQYDFGGRGPTREILIQELKDGLASKRYSPEQVQNLLDFEFDKNGKGKLTTVGKAFERQLEDLPDLIRKAERGILAERLEDQSDREKAFVQDIKDRIQQRGEPLSEGEVMQLQREAQKLFGTIPQYLQTYTTLYDLDKEESDRLAKFYIAEKNFISSAEAENLHPETAANYRTQNKVLDYNLGTPPKELKRQAYDQIDGAAADAFRSAGETVGGQKERTYRINAKAFYDKAYAAAIMDPGIKSEQEAHAKALKETIATGSPSNNFGGFDKLPTYTRDQENVQRFNEAQKAIDKKSDIYQPIDALLPALQQLRQYQRRGKSTIPFEFHRLAQGLNGIDGWDLAAAQYEAHKMGTLKKPQFEQDLDKETPLVRNLVRKYSTPSRTYRAQLESSNSNMFLELVKNKESKFYGEYDAMNTGGANGGHTAYGSANSKDVFDKPLTQMTIGEVMQLQSQRRLFAAGAYQIIPKTMRFVLPLSGLSANDKFDKTAQDRLALALYQNRVRVHGTNKYSLMTGLRSEWIGLQNVDDTTLLKAMESMSIYNQPQNVLPALRGGS